MLKILKSIIFSLSTKIIKFLRKVFYSGFIFLHRLSFFAKGFTFLHRGFFLRITVSRVSAIVFTDPWYGIFYDDLNQEAQNWADKSIVVYIRSSDPLGTLLSDKSSGADFCELSAGHEEHVYTTGWARKSYLDWLLSKSSTFQDSK